MLKVKKMYKFKILKDAKCYMIKFMFETYKFFHILDN